MNEHVTDELNTNGWTNVRLGDVVTHRQDLEREPVEAGLERFLKVEHLDANRLYVSRWGEIQNDDLPPTFYKVFRQGQVLFPTRNPHLRRVACAGFDGICGEKTLTLEANGKIDSRLLPFVFQSTPFWEYAQSMAIGSTNPHVRWRDIAAYKFWLPPKNEQCRIAEILTGVEAALEAYLRCLDDAEALRYSQTEALLAEQPHAGRNGTASQDSKRWRWPQERLVDHVELASGQVDPKESPYVDMILVAPNHIETGTGRLIEKCTAGEQNAISGKYLFDQGDVVYSKIRPNLRKVFLADSPGLCSADMYPMKAKSTLNPKFLFYLLLGDRFSRFAVSESVRTGIPKLNRKSLSDYKCSIPSRDEQDRIVEIIDRTCDAVKALRSHIESLRNVKGSLVCELLQGVAHVQ